MVMELTLQRSEERIENLEAALAAECAKVADLTLNLERRGPGIEMACVELAAALGVDRHGGWRDLLAKVDTEVRRSTTWRTEIGKAFNKRISDLPVDFLHEDTGWQVVADWITSGGAFRMDIAAALGIDPWVHDGDNGGVRRTWESIVATVRELRRAAEESVVEFKKRLADVETVQRNQIASETMRADGADGELESRRNQLLGALGIQPGYEGSSNWLGLISRVTSIRCALTSETCRGDRARDDLQAVRETFDQMAKILGCGREVPQVFDAITRLKEQNSTLTSETAAQLPAERIAHACTKGRLAGPPEPDD